MVPSSLDRSPRKSALWLRVASSAVMMPIALAAIWFGGEVFAILTVVIAAVLMWEWHELLAPGQPGLRAIGIGGTTAVVAACTFDHVLVVLLVAVAFAIVMIEKGRRKGADLALLGTGPIYIGASTVALEALRQDYGLGPTAWLFLVVWATDIGAYAFGRGIGGPKLMPKVSPNKTWAGLLGGMVSAAIVGTAVAAMVGMPGWAVFGAGAAVLAVIAQAGDLFESMIKRRVGAKDSSGLIPGHGGLFDRVDGLIAAALFFVVAARAWDAIG